MRREDKGWVQYAMRIHRMYGREVHGLYIGPRNRTEVRGVEENMHTVL